MAKVVIFGLRDFASLAHFYLRHDSDHEVVGFCVDHDHLPDERIFEGKPVVALEDVEERFSPEDYRFFAPLSGRDMNRFRASVFERIKAKRYSLITYVSSRATQFPEAEIGENSFILEDNTIQPFTSIGDNVVLWSGNHIGHHSQIGSHVFFTSQVALSGHCVVEPYCYFGVNSSIRDGLRIARGTFVGMAACVTKCTEPWGVYTGVPARKREGSSTELKI